MLALKNSVLGAAMQQPPNLNQLPADLPVPMDDGAARHLKEMAMPDLEPPARQSMRTKRSPG